MADIVTTRKFGNVSCMFRFSDACEGRGEAEIGMGVVVPSLLMLIFHRRLLAVT